MYRMHAEAHEGVGSDRWAFVSAQTAELLREEPVARMGNEGAHALMEKACMNEVSPIPD
jgi:hypothetical protein